MEVNLDEERLRQTDFGISDRRRRIVMTKFLAATVLALVGSAAAFSLSIAYDSDVAHFPMGMMG
jgi:hypothetical protein